MSKVLQTEYALYSSYPALVHALVAGHIDIAWNTPLAYLQAREKLDELIRGVRKCDRVGVSEASVFLLEQWQ